MALPRRVLVVLLALGLVACGSTKASSPPTVVTSATSASTTAAPRPATANVTLVGDPDVAGLLTKDTPNCGLPTVDGKVILVMGQATPASKSVRITITADKVVIGVVSGSGAQYKERDFEGTVSGFDASKGVTLNTAVTEVPRAPGVSVAGLGAISSISGSIDCGTQRPGTSTLTFTGDTAEGRLDRATLSQYKVVNCGPTGGLVIGVTQLGGTPTLFDLHVGQGAFGFFTQSKGAAQHQYDAKVGTGRSTATGLHVDGDAVERVAAGAIPHTLHVVGDVTCAT